MVRRASGHVACSGLAAAHPGGDVLFDGVSFTVSPGRHVGLVGVNGIGKSTLLAVLSGAVAPVEGEVSVGGRLAVMAQDVGASGDGRTVRELLLALAPAPLRDAGERVHAGERRLAEGDDAAGIELGAAIADWSELGGYGLEAEWDRACRQIVRAPFAE